jgi:transposase
MSRPIKRRQVKLTDDERKELQVLSSMRTEKKCRVERALILLKSDGGMGDTAIAKEMSISRAVVNRCVLKCLSMGVAAALDDLPRSGANRVITQEDKGWIIYLACEKPTTFGYPHELWTVSLLLEHIHAHCEEKGFGRLTSLSRSKLWSILNGAEIRPHKIEYYLERRDPEFEEKMRQVLVVYKEAEQQNKDAAGQNDFVPDKITISYDEKPGIQVLAGTVADLPPQPYLYKATGRDYEYVRHGTLSLLAGIDLHDGTVCAHISKTHKSSDFIVFLQKLDAYYPRRLKIRLVPDNHSAHTSKETREFLSTMPNRFEFVFTPKHGSWLNLIETFFGKMAHTVLRGIRAESDEEMTRRLYQYIDGINQSPVVFRWKYKMGETLL